jgi:hypothetical protein
MPRNARQLQTRVRASDGGGIGMTDSACFHPNPNLSRSRLGDLPFHYSKRARRGNFHCFVCACHLNPLFFLNSVFQLQRWVLVPAVSGHFEIIISSFKT